MRATRMRTTCLRTIIVPLLGIAIVAGCSESGPSAPPAGVELSLATQGCDLAGALGAARDYFPGSGAGSIRDQALTILRRMESNCTNGDGEGYRSGFIDIADLVEATVESGAGGPPGAGDDVLWGVLSLQTGAGAPILDLCGGDPNCEPWDGFPVRPDFTAALSPGGAWALVTTGTNAVCSGHRSPCPAIDPATDGDVWGVEPSDTWERALFGRASILYGAPLAGGSPTGEALLATAVPAYQWNLIPHPASFQPDASPPAVLEVGLCSTALAGLDESLVQKGPTILQEAFLSFCPGQLAGSGATGFLATMVRALDPRPRPLVATTFRGGPGGSAGSFSDFWATDLPGTATFEFLNLPTDARAGELITGADGTPVRVRAVTTSMGSPIERAGVTILLRRNNGLVPSGNQIRVDPASGSGIVCGADGTCSGFTQADQESAPGELEIPLQVTKTGGYRMCLVGQIAPLQFDEICSPKFNVRPARKK